MGETWSEPSMGKIKWTDGTDKYVAFVGGGYDTDDNNQSGKAFFMIDLATGDKLAEYYNDEVTIDDRQYMNFSIAANPTAIDEDGDGYVDLVYVGDVGGQLWKFEPTVTQVTIGVTWVDMKWASDVSGSVPPTPCPTHCWAYDPDTQGGSPEAVPLALRGTDLGYVSLDDSISGTWGNGSKIGGVDLKDLTFISENATTPTTYTYEFLDKDSLLQTGDFTKQFAVDSSTFSLTGKRLFAADTVQPNTPVVEEYYPAQAIYGAPSVAKDDAGNLWVSFGTGDRNHPLNSSTNRFYGIKDNTTMTNANTLTESDLLEIDSNDTTVSTSIQGWYFTLASDEKVLAAADTFNSTVFFTTFTPDSGSADVCGSGGGTAKLYAVKMQSGFAALDFTSTDNEALTANYVGTSRWTKIGDGIPSKPAVMINPNGNPSVITGTTSQQISSEKVPDPALPQLLGWREVF